MMNCYKLVQEDKNDIDFLINNFYNDIEHEFEKLSFLDIVSDITCERDNFLNEFVKVHQEIRQTNHKIRHFILMKTNKIKKENANTIPLMDIIGAFSNDIEKKYWDMTQHVYIMLESACDDKQDEVINTITIELQKRDDKLKEQMLEIEAKKQRELDIIERKNKAREERAEKQKLPDIDEMLSHMDNNPEMMEMFNKMSGGASTNDMGNTIKQAMNENPEMTSMFKNAMAMMKESGDDSDMDVMGIVEQFIPNIDMNCHTNVVLLNKIYNDIVYVFSTAENETSDIKDRLMDKITSYRHIIESGKLTPEEIISCIWKISTHEDMKNYIINMEKTELNFAIALDIATTILPDGWTDKLGDLGNMAGMGDLGALKDLAGPDMIEKMKEMAGTMGVNSGNMDIGSIMNMFNGANLGKPEAEPELTEEQMLELEKYYDDNV